MTVPQIRNTRCVGEKQAQSRKEEMMGEGKIRLKPQKTQKHKGENADGFFVFFVSFVVDLASLPLCITESLDEIFSSPLPLGQAAVGSDCMAPTRLPSVSLK
jgi:hypothetical protein